MELTVKALNSKAAGTVSVSEVHFNREFNESLVHQVVTAYLAGSRQGSHAQKTRAEVRGGGKKPWGQKGTGRARAGTIRSPLWRGGGIIFAATQQDYSQKVNRKMYRGALCCIVSELVRQNRMIVLDKIDMQKPKTRALVETLKGLNVDSALIVTAELDENLYLSARNIHGVDVCDVQGVDPVSMLRYNHVLITVPALKQLEELLS